MHRSRRPLAVLLAALAGVGAYVLVTAGRTSGPSAGRADPAGAAGLDGPGAIVRVDVPTLAPWPIPRAREAEEETHLEGVVLDGETGDAVHGARVRWWPIEAETDAGGTYRLHAHGALPEAGEVVARAEGYVDGSTSCDRQVWSPAGRLGPIFLARVRERRLGRVRDGLDRPVRGAVILVGPGNARYVSREDGSFGPVPIGDRGLEWRAFSSREGRAEDTRDRDETAPELEVVMPVAAFVDGEVVDEEGLPVVGAEVFLLRHADELRVVTGPGGQFRWPLAATSEAIVAATTRDRAGFHAAYAGAPVRIVARKDGRLPGPTAGPSPPPSSDPRYREGAERVTIRSQVVDYRGRALPGAEVWVRAPVGSWHTFERTDADGRFSLEVYAAPVDVSIWHSDAGTSWELRLEADRAALPLRVPLSRRTERAREPDEPTQHRPRVLEGRVLDAEGRPVPEVEVSATGTDELDHTDVRGAFALEGLPTDRSAILMIRAGVNAPLELVSPLGTPSLRIVLPARGAIVITLRGAPTAASDSTGSAYRLGTSDEAKDVFLEARHSEDGCVLELGDRVRIDAPVGRFVLRFRREPGAWVRFAPVNVVAGRGTPLTYDFPALGRLRVTALDPQGTPVEGATISLAEVDGLLGDTGADGVLVPRPDDSDGTVPAGVHRLLVVSEGFVPAFTDPVDLRQDAEVSVRLARGESFSGDVADAEGRPSGGGTLSWRVPFGPPVLLGAVDTDGTFGPLIPLPTGRQTLVLNRAGSPDVDLAVDVRPGASGQPLHLRVK